ncbi:MAG: hypothetical protein AAF518_14330 [Spirochaetota bacterium]
MYYYDIRLKKNRKKSTEEEAFFGWYSLNSQNFDSDSNVLNWYTIHTEDWKISQFEITKKNAINVKVNFKIYGRFIHESSIFDESIKEQTYDIKLVQENTHLKVKYISERELCTRTYLLNFLKPRPGNKKYEKIYKKLKQKWKM